MTLFSRRSSPDWLKATQVLVGIGLMVLMFVPSASGAPVLDTVTATGSGSLGGIGFSNVNISAQSTPSGQNPSGTVSFTVTPFGFDLSGPVTCVSVTGPDRGPGTAAAPTTAVLNFMQTNPSGFFPGINTVQLTDNGGNGTDVMLGDPTGRAPNDCLPLSVGTNSILTNGRAVVVDAPLVPTSQDQCRNGSWMNFPQFKNQGDCVSFVETGK